MNVMRMFDDSMLQCVRLDLLLLLPGDGNLLLQCISLCVSVNLAAVLDD